MWFMALTWLSAPFLFNPSCFEWQNIVGDWTAWNKWISNRQDIAVLPKQGWESWWEKEQEPRHSGKRGIVVEIVVALSFFIDQYGFIYHLNITKHTKGVLIVLFGQMERYLCRIQFVRHARFSGDAARVYKKSPRTIVYLPFILIYLLYTPFIAVVPHE